MIYGTNTGFASLISAKLHTTVVSAVLPNSFSANAVKNLAAASLLTVAKGIYSSTEFATEDKPSVFIKFTASTHSGFTFAACTVAILVIAWVAIIATAVTLAINFLMFMCVFKIRYKMLTRVIPVLVPALIVS